MEPEVVLQDVAEASSSTYQPEERSRPNSVQSKDIESNVTRTTPAILSRPESPAVFRVNLDPPPLPRVTIVDQDAGNEPAYLQYVYLAKGRPRDYELESSSKGWSVVDAALKNLDESKIRGCKEDMDAILLFAGLFSVVLAIFNMSVYLVLQFNTAQLSTLIALSAHFGSNLTVNQELLSPIQNPTAASTSINLPTSTIRVMSLWFCALVASLVVGALAILVKQWLREFPPGDWINPQEHIRIRNFRHYGLISWRVLDIAAALPALLQISLILFLIGLSELTRDINLIVGWVTTGLMICWFAILLITTLSPLLSTQCPYKTPFLSKPLATIRDFVLQCNLKIQSWWTGQLDDRIPLHEGFVRADPSQDVSILAAADSFFLDDDLLPSIRLCLAEHRIEFVLDWVREMVKNRTGGRDVKDLDEFTLYAIARKGLVSTVQTLFDAMERDLNFTERFNPLSLQFGLSGYVQTAMKLVLRVVLYVPELVGPGSMFGSFVNRLLGTSKPIREDLIRHVLSRDWYVPPESPWITEEQDVIATTSDLLSSFVAPSPDSLACAFLNLTLHTDDQTLRTLRPEIQALFTSLANRMLDPAFVLQEDDATKRDCRARTCLYICRQLNGRIPGFVGKNLVDALQGITR